MKASELEKKFDSGEDITEMLDLSETKKASQSLKHINVDIPLWMIERLARISHRK